MDPSPLPGSDLQRLAAGAPPWAGDIAASVARLAVLDLSARQLWGSLLAASLCIPGDLARGVVEQARGVLSEIEIEAVGSVVSLMSMNSVFGRFCHITSHESLRPARLGMSATALADPPVDRMDFELWAVVVAALHGCARCVDSHVTAARRCGASDGLVLDVVRVAAVAQGLAATARAAGVLGQAADAAPEASRG